MNNPISYRDFLGLDIWIGGPSGYDGAPLHQSINVGAPVGAYVSVSFGCPGMVYEDTSKGGPIERYKRSVDAGAEAAFKKDLLGQVGKLKPYFPISIGCAKNCRDFSKEWFDKAPGEEGPPPQRPSAPWYWTSAPVLSTSSTGSSSTNTTSIGEMR